MCLCLHLLLAFIGIYFGHPSPKVSGGVKCSGRFCQRQRGAALSFPFLKQCPQGGPWSGRNGKAFWQKKLKIKEPLRNPLRTFSPSGLSLKPSPVSAVGLNAISFCLLCTSLITAFFFSRPFSFSHSRFSLWPSIFFLLLLIWPTKSTLPLCPAHNMEFCKRR